MLKAELDRQLLQRRWMVLGEGAVFALMLILGFWAVGKSIAKELTVAGQQKNFLLSITHELKSPLAAIKLQLQTLKTRQLPEEKRKQLYERSLKDSGRLQKLVENLLLVNKVESGILPLSKEQTDLTALLLELMQTSYAEEMEDGKVRLSLDEGVIAHVDVLAVQSMLSNLVDNALKYAPDSEITVGLHVKDHVMLTVADKGPGIPDSAKERIFDRFCRLGNEETRTAKGTGIGLYLVRSLVVLHGGSIRVTDNSPTGAIFTADLPGRAD